jgi:hypothetical protein
LELQLTSAEPTRPQIICAEPTSPAAGTTEWSTNVLAIVDTGSRIWTVGYGAQMFKSTDALPVVGTLGIGAVFAIVQSNVDPGANPASRVLVTRGSGCDASGFRREESVARRVYYLDNAGQAARKQTWHEIAHEIFPGSRNLEGEERAAYRRVIARLFRPA